MAHVGKELGFEPGRFQRRIPGLFKVIFQPDPISNVLGCAEQFYWQALFIENNL